VVIGGEQHRVRVGGPGHRRIGFARAADVVQELGGRERRVHGEHELRAVSVVGHPGGHGDLQGIDRAAVV
jgi:hypothetical protein